MKPEDDSFLYDLTLVGYARVSTEDQNLDMQVNALTRAGCHPDRILREFVSGAATRRPQRSLALKLLRPGSTLVVWKLDRVSRSITDLLRFVEQLEAIPAKFRSLTEAIDTTTPMGRVFLVMLGAFAQFERDTIRERTKAGVVRALERGVKFGQPVRFKDEIIAKAEDMIRSGMSIRAVAEALGFAPATVRLHIKTDRINELRAEGPKKKAAGEGGPSDGEDR